MISSVVLLEVYFTLRSFYSYSNKECQQILDQIINLEHLSFVDKVDYQKALFLFQTYRVKFPDRLITSVKFLQEGGAIISYDHDFDKLGIKREEPAQFLKKVE